MEPRRFQLEGLTLDGLKARIRSEHGPDAKIVVAEKVTVGGIRGFFARQHYEVTVEVPARRRRGAHARLDLPVRLGIAALLDDADDAEARIYGAPPERIVSTASADFAALMDELTFNTARVSDLPTAPAPELPRPLTGPGDLVMIVGLGEDPLNVAQSMADAVGSGGVSVAGGLIADGAGRVEDRRSALVARARGVENGHSTFVALGLGRGGNDVALRAAALGSVGADQVWVVVDAGRKPEDTARWVHAVAAAVPIDAVAALGSDATSSPETVNELGMLVGWMDGGATPSPTGRRAAPLEPGRVDASR